MICAFGSGWFDLEYVIEQDSRNEFIKMDFLNLKKVHNFLDYLFKSEITV